MKKSIITKTIQMPFALILLLIFLVKRMPNLKICIVKIIQRTLMLKNCIPGVLKQEVKTEVLDYINYIRNIHHLPPVSYNYDLDEYTQNAALSMVANNFATHYPEPNSHCFNDYVKLGCQKSNLHLVSGSKNVEISNKMPIDGFLNELENTVEIIGHRRWILDPFLKHIAFGRVDGKSKVNNSNYANGFALYVINDEQADISNLNIDFVSYPYESYPKIYLI
ncbi:MAG: CAP domain-containing protein [Bacteroidetes bacterium]|nr:CAP domain-containing protein [Bacteroidota bacterium]